MTGAASVQGPFLIGVDLGTQSAKVVVFAASGAVVCATQQPLRPIVTPSADVAEHPDDDLWDALQQALRAAMAAFRERCPGQDQAIAGLGLCTIRCCRVLLRADGSLAWPVISWMDQRLNGPYAADPRYGEVAYVTTTSGYITHRLTSAMRDTAANYMGAWPLDEEQAAWSTDPGEFERCQVRRDQLFELVQPGEVLGQVTPAAARVTGLPENLPVVATAHDKAVEALGAGGLEPGTGQISLGTYIGVWVPGTSYRRNPQTFFMAPGSRPGHYLYECMGVRRGMWTISWFFEQFGAAAARHGESAASYFNRVGAAVPAGSEGLVTIHDWAPPTDATYRRGIFCGFDGRHTDAHMYRSLLEGIALTLVNNMQPMLTELGQDLRQLVVSGGGSNSDLFMQIIADVFGVPSYRPKHNAAVAVGCVLNAGVATGVFSDYDEAAQRFVEAADVFQPTPANHTLYRELARTYAQAAKAFDPFLENMARLPL